MTERKWSESLFGVNTNIDNQLGDSLSGHMNVCDGERAPSCKGIAVRSPYSVQKWMNFEKADAMSDEAILNENVNRNLEFRDRCRSTPSPGGFAKFR